MATNTATKIERSNTTWLDEAEARCAAATKGPWEFIPGTDKNGDSCDLLMAEIPSAAPADEDPEYAQVLFGNELGEQQLSANWDFAAHARTDLPRALDALREAEKALEEIYQASEPCGSDYGHGGVAKIARAALSEIRGNDER